MVASPLSTSAREDPRPDAPRALLPTVLRVLASFASGLAVAFAFAPFDLVWLMPLGVAGLMLTIKDRGTWGGLGHGLAFGLGFMLPLMRWITVIGTDAWLGLGLLEASFYGLMGVGWAWTRDRRWWPFAAASIWVGAELLRATVPWGGMPWGKLAFGLVDTSLVRYGRVGGTALVSFVVVLVVALVVYAVEHRSRGRVALAAGAGALALALGSLLLPVGLAGQVGSAQIVAVQGNVPGEGMDAFAERRAVLHNHAEATHELAADVASGDAPAPDIVIWPENSTDIDPFRDSSAYDEIDAAVKAIGVPVLVGAVVFGPDEDHVQNMGVVWDPVTGPGDDYVKRHIVPFGEYIPMRSLVATLFNRLDQIPRDFARGTKNGALDLAGVTVGDVICFEVAYDGLVRSVVDAGGQVIVVQTNNATYAGTGQLEQQFAISRYRAVETGRSVVVAATNGISGVIAADGSVVEETSQKTRAIVNEQVALGEGVTWGVRLGWWVELAVALGGLALMVVAYLGRRRAAGKMGQ
jgi:apolipoprotein N-acyltransferase